VASANKTRAQTRRGTGPGTARRGRATPKSKISAQISDWHYAEDLYFREVYNAPGLYTASVRLVRALTDYLGRFSEVDALLEAYQQSDICDVASLVDDLELPYSETLDYDLARDVAFFMRYREIVEAQGESEYQARVAKARAEGAEWVVLFGDEARDHGHAPIQRLEMHLPDGISLHISRDETDNFERGYVYVIESIVLDPDTGKIRPEVPSPGPSQEFATREEVFAALAALRVKYSTGSVQSETNDAEET
jgi:hypothetical protein